MRNGASHNSLNHNEERAKWVVLWSAVVFFSLVIAIFWAFNFAKELKSKEISAPDTQLGDFFQEIKNINIDIPNLSEISGVQEVIIE